jgi:hypothetical protein
MLNQRFDARGAAWRYCRAIGALAGLLLSACEGRFSADLATDPPADPAINQLQVSVLGLEFRKSDGATSTLEFRAAEAVDLLDLREGDPMRLFTSEQLPAGRYTGVRLLFDAGQDATVVNTDGDVFPVLLVDGPFASIDFSIEDNKSSSEQLTLALDLRQSLSFDDIDDEFTLTPVVRTVRTSQAAQISGTVTASCPAGTSLILGGAVYAYLGADVTPDDLDTTAPEPYATTSVTLDTNSNQFGYALRFLPGDDYTLALTCRGNEDDLLADDDLEFGDGVNVTVAAGATLSRNLN